MSSKKPPFRRFFRRALDLSQNYYNIPFQFKKQKTSTLAWIFFDMKE